MPVQTLTCPQCDAPLDPPSGRTQFFCQFCGATVVIPRSLQSNVDEPPREDMKEPLRPAPDLSKFTIDKHGDELVISWSWRTWLLLFLIPFAVFWNAITWTIAGAFLVGGMMNDVPWYFGFAGLIAVPHICIGLGLIYFIAATFFNRTTVRVSQYDLSITHGPVPWKSPAPINVDEIEQLYVKEKISRGKNGSSASYQLHALLKNGSSHKLLNWATDPSIPQAVERMIEVHLDIRDQPVKGEH